VANCGDCRAVIARKDNGQSYVYLHTVGRV